MCGVAQNPDEVTNEPKIYGVESVGESPTTGGRGGCSWSVSPCIVVFLCQQHEYQIHT